MKNTEMKSEKRIYSSDLRDICRYVCEVCGSDTEFLENHMNEKHDAEIKDASVEYDQDRDFDLKRWHSCALCGQDIIFTRDILISHVKFNHEISAQEYFDQYLVGDGKPTVNFEDYFESEGEEYVEDKVFSSSFSDLVKVNCEICKKDVEKDIFFSAHLFKHSMLPKAYIAEHGKPKVLRNTYHKCQVCGKDFLFTRSDLAGHVLSYHKMKMKLYADKFIHRAKAVPPLNADCVVSNDYSNECIVKCKVCLKEVLFKTIYNHITQVHSMKYMEYRARHGELEFVKKTFHQCGICHQTVLLAANTIRKHVSQHKITLSDYNQQYMQENSVLFSDYNREEDAAASAGHGGRVTGSQKAPQWCDGTMYKCPFCFNIYYRYFTFRIHLIRSHQVENSEDRTQYLRSCEILTDVYQCKLCSINIKRDRMDIEAHLKDKHRTTMRVYAQHFEQDELTDASQLATVKRLLREGNIANVSSVKLSKKPVAAAAGSIKVEPIQITPDSAADESQSTLDYQKSFEHFLSADLVGPILPGEETKPGRRKKSAGSAAKISKTIAAKGSSGSEPKKTGGKEAHETDTPDLDRSQEIVEPESSTRSVRRQRKLPKRFCSDGFVSPIRALLADENTGEALNESLGKVSSAAGTPSVHKKKSTAKPPILSVDMPPAQSTCTSPGVGRSRSHPADRETSLAQTDPLPSNPMNSGSSGALGRGRKRKLTAKASLVHPELSSESLDTGSEDDFVAAKRRRDTDYHPPKQKFKSLYECKKIYISETVASPGVKQSSPAQGDHSSWTALLGHVNSSPKTTDDTPAGDTEDTATTHAGGRPNRSRDKWETRRSDAEQYSQPSLHNETADPNQQKEITPGSKPRRPVSKRLLAAGAEGTKPGKENMSNKSKDELLRGCRILKYSARVDQTNPSSKQTVQLTKLAKVPSTATQDKGTNSVEESRSSGTSSSGNIKAEPTSENQEAEVEVELKFRCPMKKCEWTCTQAGLRQGPAVLHLLRVHGIQPLDMQARGIKFNAAV